MIAAEDVKMLNELLAWVDEGGLDDDDSPWIAAFRDMRRRDRPLSDKQRAWLRSVHERVLGTPNYENAWGAGKVPRGEALATPVPEVLKAPLPKRPPPRRMP